MITILIFAVVGFLLGIFFELPLGEKVFFISIFTLMGGMGGYLIATGIFHATDFIKTCSIFTCS